MIELTTYPTDVNPFFEFDRDDLNEIAYLFPEVSLSQVIEKTVTKIREFSPILIGENPYSPTDNFIVKCLKYVVASARALFFKTDEIRAALRAYQASNEIVQILNQKINDLEEKINDHFNEILSLQFELELNKSLLGESSNDLEDVLDISIDSYRLVLDARKYYGSGEQKVFLTPDSKDELCLQKKRQLRQETQQIRENAPSIDLQKRNVEIQQCLEELLVRKTTFTEELYVIEESMRNPLEPQLQ